MYSLPYLEPICCSMSSSNCCFLICVQNSQEAGKVVWHSRLFKNFPQFVMIHTVKGLAWSIKQNWNIFWNSLAFSMIQQMLAIWSLVPLPFLNPAWTSGISWFMYCWRLTWSNLSITLLACEMIATCVVVWTFFYIAFGIGMKNRHFPVLWPLLSFPNLLAYWVQHFNSIIF